MEIQYLKKYDQNKLNNKLRRRNPEGKTIAEIEALEQEFNEGNPFPQAFREFLYIGGKWNGIGIQDGIDGNYSGLRKYYDKRLAERGIPFTRPYIVFDDFEGENCTFIYLDEGDNPQPYNCSVNPSYDHDDGRTIWTIPEKSFTEMIGNLVYRALNGLPSS